MGGGSFQSSQSPSNAALFGLLRQQQQQASVAPQPSASAVNDAHSNLIQALLQHQQQQQKQREDQEKAILFQKLRELSKPATQRQHPTPDEIAMLLQLQQKQFSNPGSSNVTMGSMGGSSNPLHSANFSANLASAAPGRQLDAATIASLLQGQNTSAPSLSGLSSVAQSVQDASHQHNGMDMTGMSALGDRRRKGRTGTFPQKLHQMLSDLERQEGGAEIASFLPHGRAFAIHKPRDFVKHVMPKYFRMSRFSSFQRQLNLYDFQRITEGPDKGSYYHELFVQGRPILSTMMKRNKIKGIKNKNNESPAASAPIAEDEAAEDDDIEQEEI